MTRFHVDALGPYGPLAGYCDLHEAENLQHPDKLNFGFKCHVTLLA